MHAPSLLALTLTLVLALTFTPTPTTGHPAPTPDNPLEAPTYISTVCARPNNARLIPPSDITAAANSFLSKCTRSKGPTFPHLGDTAYQTREYSSCYSYASAGKAMLSVCLEDGMSVTGAQAFNRWGCSHAAAAWAMLGDRKRCEKEKDGETVVQGMWVLGDFGFLHLEHADLAKGKVIDF